jgi:hypothetical protein
MKGVNNMQISIINNHNSPLRNKVLKQEGYFTDWFDRYRSEEELLEIEKVCNQFKKELANRAEPPSDAFLRHLVNLRNYFNNTYAERS